MDSLPVELIRLIFESCDPASVRCLRLQSSRLAEVGYDFLIPADFTALAWRDDLKRLHSIATHDRLQSSIRSVTINFGEVEEYNARHASYFQHYVQEPEERAIVLRDAWAEYFQLEKRRKASEPFESQSDAVEEAFAQLPNLTNLMIAYTHCPYDIQVFKEAFQVPNCRRMHYQDACNNLSLVVTAMQKSSVTSFTVDRLPLELFRISGCRKRWFDCVDTFARLRRLDLTLDTTNSTLPNAKFKSLNGLGYVLRMSPNLTHLSLAFHNYDQPKCKFFSSCFEEVFDGGVTFHHLTDLKLGGFACEEAHLKAFLRRHSSSLERLRLGGRGLAKGFELALGGISLCRGTFRSLFSGLSGKMPKLQRFHMEGDFNSDSTDMTDAKESYHFHPTTDDDWNPVPIKERVRHGRTTRDSTTLETYLIHGGDYPSA
jgi:hypothetical protein